MFRLRLPLIFLFVSAGVLAGQAALVGQIKQQNVIRGCALTASSTVVGGGLILLAERDESQVIMNIDGVDVQLKVVGKSGKLQVVGDVLERIYRAPGIEVKARYKVTADCSASTSESCEVTGFTVTFDVSKDGRMQAIQAVGESGC